MVRIFFEAAWFNLLFCQRLRTVASRVNEYEPFMASVRNAIAVEAAKMWPDATAITPSEDIVSPRHRCCCHKLSLLMFRRRSLERTRCSHLTST
jgi:hypothetical protein